MADKCNVCGDRFGKFKASRTLSFKSNSLELCAQCQEKGLKALEEVSDPSNAMAVHARNAARGYFAEAVEKGSCEPSALIAIEALAGITEEDKREARERAAKEAEARELFFEKRDSIIVTTAATIPTHKVTAYHGVLNATVTAGTSMLTELAADFNDAMGAGSKGIEQKTDITCKSALERLVKKAVFSGGNAVTGVTFNVFVFGDNMIGVTASGTSVTIEELPL